MKSLLITVLCVYCGMSAHSQQQSPYRIVLEDSFQQTVPTSAMPLLQEEADSHPGDKSRFLGVVYSLILPGMGELYAGKFERGHVPLIVEGFLWLGLAWFNSYGAWIEDEALTFATQHSGANFDGKQEGYQVDVENFDDIYQYNNFKLVNRDLGALYPAAPGEGYYWKWDSFQNREKYEQMRIKSDEMFNATSFVVLGMIANRVWSAIKASLAVRDHNNELRAGQSSLLPDMRTRITTFNGTVDGLEMQFVQHF